MANPVSDKPKKSLNDVRAPVMMLYVLAYCGGHMSALPLWGLVLGSVVIFVSVALVYERQGIRSMAVRDLKGILLGLGCAIVLYVLFAGAMQMLVQTVVRIGAVIERDALPPLLSMLLDIRSHAQQLLGPLLGLSGALLLAPTEEMFWRGFVQQRLVSRIGPFIGISVTTLLYAGFWAILVNPLAGIAAAVAGLAFGVLTHRTGSLFPAAVAHGALWISGMWAMPLY